MYIATMKNERKKIILNIFLDIQNPKKDNSEIIFW
jgi:hypothetical protein